MTVQDMNSRDSRPWRGERVVGIAFHLVPETVLVSDDEAEVPDLRSVDARIVNLVHDAVADRKPQTRGTERRTDHVLGTTGPCRTNSGCSRRIHSLASLIAPRPGPSLIGVLVGGR